MPDLRKLVALAALALVACVVLWLSIPHPSSPAHSPATTSPETVDISPRLAVAAPSADEPILSRDVLVAPSSPPDADIAPDATPAGEGQGSLAVSVQDPDGRPLESIRIQVTLDDEPGGRALRFVEIHRGGLDAAPLTDFLGRALCFVPAERAGVLHVRSEAPGLEPRTLAFAPLAPFEERPVSVVLRRALDTALERRVVDAASGAPLAGVLVRLREEDRTLGGVTTDADGRFRLAWDGWRDVHLRLDAKGRSAALVSLAADVPDPIPLLASATLVVEATEPNGLPMAGLRAVALGMLADELPAPLRTPGMQAERFGTGAASSRQSVEGASILRLADLPAGIALAMTLRWREGAESTRLHLAPFAPGEVRSLRWSPPLPRTVRGRLVDADDTPLAGQEIWLVRLQTDEARFFHLGISPERSADPSPGYHACGSPRSEATTGADGTFRFEGVSPALYRIGPAPGCDPPYASTNRNAVAPWGEVLEVVEDEDPSVLLERPRELFVRCSVVDGDGRPRRATIFATCEESAWSQDFDGGEPILVGPLVGGVHRLRAEGTDRFSPTGFARSAPRSARPERGGGDLIELVLVPDGAEGSAGRVAGLVVDGHYGALVTEVHAIEAENAAPALEDVARLLRSTAIASFWPSMRSTWSDGLGRFALDGLEPGAWVLFARQGDALGLAHVRVPGRGDRVLDVVLRLAPPAWVSIERADSYGGSYRALLDGLVVGSGDWRREEPFPVPPGPLVLELSPVAHDERFVLRTLELASGETAALDLTAER